jgi:ubiquinone/menaquinone biosynthesis C-methylase UbiE
VEGHRPPARIRIVGQALTRLVARSPLAWRLLRRPIRNFFDRAAPGWDGCIAPEGQHLEALEAAVDRLDRVPERILDLGTGSGVAALWLARRFPGARVTGVDLSEAMIEVARGKLDGELSGRVEFAVADAAKLPYGPESFDLVAQVSVPVFFDEIARVLAPGGHAVVVSSLGPATPFHTPPRMLDRGFRQRGLEPVDEGAAGVGTWFTARAGTVPKAP